MAAIVSLRLLADEMELVGDEMRAFLVHECHPSVSPSPICCLLCSRKLLVKPGSNPEQMLRMNATALGVIQGF